VWSSGVQQKSRVSRGRQSAFLGDRLQPAGWRGKVAAVSAGEYERRRQSAEQAAQLLRDCGARRVWLFGSLARGRQPDFRSDVDLAVEGLPGEQYFRLVSELQSLVCSPVDLVEMERAPAALRDRILAEGVVLAQAEDVEDP
jgi:predicted nucleotidyltransferase